MRYEAGGLVGRVARHLVPLNGISVVFSLDNGPLFDYNGSRRTTAGWINGRSPGSYPGQMRSTRIPATIHSP